MSVDFIHKVDDKKRHYLLASYFMDNISKEVVDSQQKVFRKFGLNLLQFKSYKQHPFALNDIIRNINGFDYVIFFDIDAIPMTENAVHKLLYNCDFYNGIVGASQQANHINTDHIYAGPSCLAMSMEIYERLGRPSFEWTKRSDVGEEITWLSQERGIPVCLLKTSSIELEKWALGKDGRFGLGTTYENEIYHAFESRFESERFIEKCRSVLAH